MATVSEIAAVREYINEPLNAEPYTDLKISEVVDEKGSTYGAASEFWVRKAAGLAMLVDVTESGSSRKMGDARKNALEMAAYFSELADSATRSRRPRVGRIVREYGSA